MFHVPGFRIKEKKQDKDLIEEGLTVLHDRSLYMPEPLRKDVFHGTLNLELGTWNGLLSWNLERSFVLEPGTIL